jgi:hypothetical protein
MRRCALLLYCLLLSGWSRADGVMDEIFDGGHTKLRLNAAQYPDDSIVSAFGDDPAFDQGGGLRLKFGTEDTGWAVRADYQLIAQFGDSLELGRALPGLALLPPVVQDDDQRLMDLTDVISDKDDQVVIQRLDRLYGELRQDKWVARAGRQAVSWGNSLIYTPMDFLNPFDPAAVDTEYKSGDDMLYGQYLRANGDDWQFVWVARRDRDNNTDSKVNSLALKYHGFSGEFEYDLLLSEHYDDTIIGVGGSLPWGGAVLRADITVTDTPDDTVWSAVGSWSWSWVLGGKNMSGVVEYYYNGFGQGNEDYALDNLAQNPDLLRRLARGELFTLGEHYLAGSVLVEVTPLLHLTPNLFVNLDDGSLLAQLVGQYDLAQDWQLLCAVNLPVGSSDSEYGGFDSGIEDFEISYGASVFAQLAWYF